MNGVQGYGVQEEQQKGGFDFNKIKIFIIIGVILIVLVLGIFWFRSFYKNNMVNYKATVEEALDTYYISGDSKDLKPIVNYFSDYVDNVKVKEDIQSFCYEEVTNWVHYIDEKYMCDLANANSCELQLKEYNEVLTKIERMYSFKEVQGYKIITSQAHSSIVEDLKKKIAFNEDIISNINSSSPKSEDEIRLAKCAQTNECTNCRNNTCTCVYVNNGVREDVICRNKIDTSKNN